MLIASRCWRHWANVKAIKGDKWAEPTPKREKGREMPYGKTEQPESQT